MPPAAAGLTLTPPGNLTLTARIAELFTPRAFWFASWGTWTLTFNPVGLDPELVLPWTPSSGPKLSSLQPLNAGDTYDASVLVSVGACQLSPVTVLSSGTPHLVGSERNGAGAVVSLLLQGFIVGSDSDLKRQPQPRCAWGGGGAGAPQPG